MSKQYETVIGLEVHVELATKTKIFCSCSTEFGGAPNTHTCPVCTGMPGSLPVLNKQVVEYAAAVGLATNCTITQNCKFDRKNYFYPDNPQNYQISQLYYPICRNGYVEIETPAGPKKIGIHEIHMEEDADCSIFQSQIWFFLTIWMKRIAISSFSKQIKWSDHNNAGVIQKIKTARPRS